ncbi:hypothetical protein CERZMDRAFT_34276 [Cercospora zeae-maydis SCOH1-5]|uniref:Isochorismatase-like domain-containing protein n=1 Tax=Cercospora zeae-maydis SCOH1-5 TaxID=717836 RepID=A0A6A6FR08_9PEZI|nr:hypothetical protein CERZMDRAFT_34276 [Cercospora zeae-maydis SCOH1-5]
MACFDTSDKTSPGNYSPAHTALLLTDFHQFLIENASGPVGKVAAEKASELRTWAKSKGIKVVHSLIDLDAEPFETCKDFDRFRSVIRTMRESSKGPEPATLTSGTADPTFFRQPGTVSALTAPGLEQYLRDNSIVSLIVAGLSTSGSVARTVFAATDAKFVVTTISDACADPDEALQDAFVNKVLGSRGYTATAAEFIEGYDKLTN